MNLIFLDLETTGLIPGRRAILDICCVETDRQGKEIWRVSSKVKPNKYQLELADSKALEINGYTAEKWEQLGARDFHNINDELMDKINSLNRKIPIGWNVNFDLEFLRERTLITKFMYHHPLDLMSMVWHKYALADHDTIKHWLGQIHEERPSLSKAYKMVIGKEMINSHTAEGDVNACIEIYRSLL